MKHLRLTIVIALVVSVMLTVSPAFALTNSAQTTTAQRNAIAYNWTYYARGWYENNCLAYAIGVTDRWIWPWGSSNPTLTQVTTYMSTQGYMANAVAAKRVYCYGSPSAVTHFSKNISVSSSQVRAKWGHCEIFNHSTNNPYKPTPYGPYVYAYSKA